MEETAIRVTGLSKIYHIGNNLGSVTLAERLRQKLRRKTKVKQEAETFFALKDVSFEIKKGEAVGIIGRNGAGKSTLLKILSQITEPTTGTIEINGTIASVLEVGMGFHPELTGRENVFLSGTMLGIPKKKIAEKFDEIVQFAGVEKFIDTPVKHYSSGMYVRLAFSVVANVDADILLFDEVLSVGDLAFQMKCAKKIKELTDKKKTILLVSHNMNDMLWLCTRVICFEKGIVADMGNVEVMKRYSENSVSISHDSETNDLPNKHNSKAPVFENTLLKQWSILEEAPGDDSLRLKKLFISNETDLSGGAFSTAHAFSINVEYEKTNEEALYDIGFTLSHFNHQFMILHTFNSGLDFEKINNKGKHRIKVKLDAHLFSDTIIQIGLSIVSNKGFFTYKPDVLSIKIQHEAEKGRYYNNFPNYFVPLLPKLHWEELNE